MFTFGLLDDDDGKVASSKKDTPNLRLNCKIHTVFKIKVATIDVLFMTKTA